MDAIKTIIFVHRIIKINTNNKQKTPDQVNSSLYVILITYKREDHSFAFDDVKIIGQVNKLKKKRFLDEIISTKIDDRINKRIEIDKLNQSYRQNFFNKNECSESHVYIILTKISGIVWP